MSLRSLALSSLVPWIVATGWIDVALASRSQEPAASAHEGAAPRRAREIVERINAGDRPALLAYAREAFAPEMLKPDADSIVDFMHEQHERLGGLEIRRTLQATDDHVLLLARGLRARDRWLRLNVAVEPTSPHRVRGFFLFAASEADDAAADAPLTLDLLPRELERYVDALAKTDDFAGAVILARDGKPLLRKAWGEADRAWHAPNRVDTRFSIASLGKMFTAVAIARLAEAKALDFGDTIAVRAPGWLAPEVADTVTIDALLTHTSGLGDYLQTLDRAPRTSLPRELAEYRQITLAERPRPAGEDPFRYSNTGYLVLGAVIESASKTSYEAFLHDQVFAPAGMTSTGLLDNDAPIENRARGYYRDESNAWRTNELLLGARGTPAGGAYSTVDDLLAFANALRDAKLLSAKACDELLRPRVEMTGTGLLYARGFTVTRRTTGGALVGHEGGFPGISAAFELDLEHDWTLIVLSNQSDAAPKVAARWHELAARVR